MNGGACSSFPGATVPGDEGQVEQQAEADDETDGAVDHNPHVYIFHARFLPECVKYFCVALRFCFILTPRTEGGGGGGGAAYSKDERGFKSIFTDGKR